MPGARAARRRAMGERWDFARVCAGWRCPPGGGEGGVSFLVGRHLTGV